MGAEESRPAGRTHYKEVDVGIILAAYQAAKKGYEIAKQGLSKLLGMAIHAVLAHLGQIGPHVHALVSPRTACSRDRFS